MFGPRISVAAMDAGAWASPADQKTWCLRMARDLWQFDQQACSSPQVLYIEKSLEQSTDQFLINLKSAFENENRAHPRQAIASSLSSEISKARASWLLDNHSHRAFFPIGPNWTILVGSGADVPPPFKARPSTSWRWMT